MASNSSDELREFLMKEIECPVCLEVPETTPIFQCIQDHVHCSVCHPKLNHCPICRSAIKMGNRNLMAEKIHEKLLQTCCYKNCSVRKVNIKEHEAECERALVNLTNLGLTLDECKHRKHGKECECRRTGLVQPLSPKSRSENRKKL